MAVRESVTSHGAGNRRAWFTTVALIVLFVAALFLRAYWNLDAAHPSEGEFILSGGSDPYYHKHAVDSIQSNDFRHVVSDPLLNYPRGAENPNPPLYQWSMAVGGKLMEPFFDPATTPTGESLTALEVATWQATIWSPAIFSALTVFTIFFIAASLFDRRAGLLAALLWTVSTSAVDAGGVGLADHDSAVLFFVTLAFAFYVQTIRRFRGDGNWVARWSDGGSIPKGLGELFAKRRSGFAYALLTAFSIAAVALTWKGFNYVLGIIFTYAIFQMVIDHWRNRDSTGLFLGSLIAMAGGVIIALPYYTTASVGNFLQPTWYILAAFFAAGLVLVPTRDLPTILVFPAGVVTALILGVAAFFVFPGVAQSLLYATVYFKQTRLYETIAEAHPADFATMVFGIGPVPFFLAVAGWVGLLFTAKRHPTRAIVFALFWAAIAVFMAQSAVRFLINAVPVFCIFAAYGGIWLLDWLNFGAIRKSLAANRGNAWQGLRKGTRPLHAVAVILIALLFVFPTTILAADAAMPPEAESRLAGESDSPFIQRFFTERMGAYGQGFGQVKPWFGPLDFLKKYDADIANPADRPAFLSWWDYGHWAIAISDHPAVADNFQNGYEFAANFILSQDEAHSIQLLAARTAEADGSDLEAALGDAGSADASGDATKIRAWQKADLTIAQSAAVLASVEAQTDKKIRYFATDIRMLPFDNPQTRNIEASSIFYAPVTLKGDKTDDYVTTQVNVGQRIPGLTEDGHMTIEQYESLARDPIRQYQVTGERLLYQPAFGDSAYWRHYVGTPIVSSTGTEILGSDVETSLNNPRPAFGLEHFRAIYLGEITRLYRGGDPTSFGSYVFYPEIILTEYFEGAVVEGTVLENGAPASGVTVTVYDDTGMLLAERYGEAVDAAQFNVPHASMVTGADGKYRLLAPFSLENGNITMVAQRSGVSLGEATLTISREQARTGAAFPGIDISIEPGNVEGVAFNDADADGVFNETNGDTIAAGISFALGGVSVTSDADGKYRADNVPAGTQTVASESPSVAVVPASSRVRVEPGQTATHDVGFQATPARAAGTLIADLDSNGTAADDEGIPFATLQFAADDTVPDNTAVTASNIFTEDNGAWTVQLQPGTYRVTANYTSPAGDAYELSETLSVTAGQTLNDVKLEMQKTTTA